MAACASCSALSAALRTAVGIELGSICFGLAASAIAAFLFCYLRGKLRPVGESPEQVANFAGSSLALGQGLRWRGDASFGDFFQTRIERPHEHVPGGRRSYT